MGDILAGTLSNAPFIVQLEMEVATELSRRLREVGDLISRNKNVLSDEQLQACFTALSKSQRRAIRGLLACKSSDIPKYLSQIGPIELSAELQANLKGWADNPGSFLKSTTGSISPDSIYWRTVERQEKTDQIIIGQRFDDFGIYIIAVRTGYHTGDKWTPSGLSDFAKGIQNHSSHRTHHSHAEILDNLEKQVSAGCFWGKWLAALAQIDDLPLEQDRTGYFFLMPRATITENQYTTNKIGNKLRCEVAGTLVELGIPAVAVRFELFELGLRLLQFIQTSSLEARITQANQSIRNPLQTFQKRPASAPAFVNGRKKPNSRSTVSLTEPTSPEETIPPPLNGHQVTSSSSVVQNPPRSGSPTSAQNPTPPIVDGLQTNNEASQPQVESASGQDTRLQSVSLLSVRGDEQQFQAAPRDTSNIQQAASTSPTQDAIGGERSADAEGASYPRQPVTGGEMVSNDGQNGGGGYQWRGIAPSQASGSLFAPLPNTEGIDNLGTSSACPLQATDFLSSDPTSGSAQTSATDPPTSNIGYGGTTTDLAVSHISYYGGPILETDLFMSHINYHGGPVLETDLPISHMSMSYINYYGGPVPETDPSMPHISYCGA